MRSKRDGRGGEEGTGWKGVATRGAGEEVPGNRRAWRRRAAVGLFDRRCAIENAAVEMDGAKGVVGGQGDVGDAVARESVRARGWLDKARLGAHSRRWSGTVQPRVSPLQDVKLLLQLELEKFGLDMCSEFKSTRRG